MISLLVDNAHPMSPQPPTICGEPRPILFLAIRFSAVYHMKYLIICAKISNGNETVQKEVPCENTSFTIKTYHEGKNQTFTTNLRINVHKGLTLNVHRYFQINIHKGLTINVHRDFQIDVHKGLTINVHRDFQIDVHKGLTINVHRYFQINIHKGLTINVHRGFQIDVHKESELSIDTSIVSESVSSSGSGYKSS
ncbi:hypothetical protein KUTeg_012831 [Tegillarca granosa]|uniref:Uncharacterized protein n=1 Tax=Tegillarca granosa TaxID=220873 RepID=A0ABQ9EWR2_TEGGR|nr:hypothetical protein KUTeg_012831 [Tegillarca granosa]